MTRRLLCVAVTAAALFACGHRESRHVTAATTAPPAKTPAVATAPPQTSTPAVTNPAEATQPESAHCLALVDQGAFSEAVPVCVKAAGLDPDNTAVKQALETAQAKTAMAAATTDQATKSAASAVGGELGKKLP